MYFISDIKKLCGSPLVRVLLCAMLLVAAADPISVYWQASRYPGFFEQIGKNPYQYWLLMNSAGWGNQVYHALFWAFPVWLTGLVYHSEKNSSLCGLLAVRGGLHAYLRGKILSTFAFSFLSFGTILLVNLAVTYLAFPSDAELTAQYQYLIPSRGSFAARIYEAGPPLAAAAYALLNALTIAVFSVIALAAHMLFPFKNRFIALAGPAAAFYAGNFLFDWVPVLRPYNIRVIVQPRAALGQTGGITFAVLLITVSGWLLAAAGLSALGVRMNREIL